MIAQFWRFATTAANWSGRNGIVHRGAQHLWLSLAATVAAAALAVPVAAWLGHIRRGGFLAQSVVNVGRAVPSLAILALVFPLALRFGFGLGFWPTFAALVVLAVPPMFTNTYAGVRNVDPAVVDASLGMGMTPTEVLLRVEVPGGIALILAGVRIAALQVIATATLGAYVGFNSLGSFITEGFGQRDDAKLLTGAVAVALCALSVDLAFGVIVRRATRWQRKGIRA